MDRDTRRVSLSKYYTAPLKYLELRIELTQFRTWPEKLSSVPILQTVPFRGNGGLWPLSCIVLNIMSWKQWHNFILLNPFFPKFVRYFRRTSLRYSEDIFSLLALQLSATRRRSLSCMFGCLLLPDIRWPSSRIHILWHHQNKPRLHHTRWSIYWIYSTIGTIMSAVRRCMFKSESTN